MPSPSEVFSATADLYKLVNPKAPAAQDPTLSPVPAPAAGDTSGDRSLWDYPVPEDEEG